MPRPNETYALGSLCPYFYRRSGARPKIPRTSTTPTPIPTPNQPLSSVTRSVPRPIAHVRPSISLRQPDRAPVFAFFNQPGPSSPPAPASPPQRGVSPPVYRPGTQHPSQGLGLPQFHADFADLVGLNRDEQTLDSDRIRAEPHPERATWYPSVHLGVDHPVPLPDPPAVVPRRFPPLSPLAAVSVRSYWRPLERSIQRVLDHHPPGSSGYLHDIWRRTRAFREALQRAGVLLTLPEDYYDYDWYGSPVHSGLTTSDEDEATEDEATSDTDAWPSEWDDPEEPVDDNDDPDHRESEPSESTWTDDEDTTAADPDAEPPAAPDFVPSSVFVPSRASASIVFDGNAGTYTSVTSFPVTDPVIPSLLTFADLVEADRFELDDDVDVSVREVPGPSVWQAVPDLACHEVPDFLVCDDADDHWAASTPPSSPSPSPQPTPCPSPPPARRSRSASPETRRPADPFFRGTFGRCRPTWATPAKSRPHSAPQTRVALDDECRVPIVHDHIRVVYVPRHFTWRQVRCPHPELRRPMDHGLPVESWHHHSGPASDVAPAMLPTWPERA